MEVEHRTKAFIQQQRKEPPKAALDRNLIGSYELELQAKVNESMDAVK